MKTRIDEMVDRFLAWPVPTSVCPDNLDADRRMRPGSSGTNLLSADEAKQMFEYVLKEDDSRFRTDPRSVAAQFTLSIQSANSALEWLVQQVEQYRSQYDEKCKMYIEQRDRADALQVKLDSKGGSK